MSVSALLRRDGPDALPGVAAIVMDLQPLVSLASHLALVVQGHKFSGLVAEHTPELALPVAVVSEGQAPLTTDQVTWLFFLFFVCVAYHVKHAVYLMCLRARHVA
jgi:hypothetical protein